MTDDVVRRLREEISELDREILGLVNRRLEAVAELKRHKDARGLPFVDPTREEQLLAERLRENAGPLSAEGLRAFYAELLALAKREVG